MYHFCTYFNHAYVIRGLALYRSLKAHAEPFTLWVLCLDDFTYDVVNKLNQPDLKPIALSEFEHGDVELLKAKQNRSMVEYFFTCSPTLPIYLFKKHPEIEILTYLDADLYFYSSPAPAYAEIGDAAFLIVRHGFPARLRRLAIYGDYNAGTFTVRNTAHAKEILNWWRERSHEWCYDRPDNGRFAHQKYLDDWMTRFEGIRESKIKGWGVAPWNWMNYRIAKTKDGWTVDGEPLIFYHFHSFKLINDWLYDPVSHGRLYGEIPLSLRWPLYREYMRDLKETERWIQTVEPSARLYSVDARGKGYGWKGVLIKALSARLMVHFSAR